MTYQISYEANPTQSDIQILGDGIQAYAKLKKNQQAMEFFAFFVRDESNNILGGCNGCMYYGCHYNIPPVNFKPLGSSNREKFA